MYNFVFGRIIDKNIVDKACNCTGNNAIDAWCVADGIVYRIVYMGTLGDGVD